MTATFLTAQDANWNLERGAFNILVDQQPAGIALPRSADDVSDVVRIRSRRRKARRRAAHRTQCGAAWLARQHRAVAHRRPWRRTDRCRCRHCASWCRRLWGDLVPRASELGLAALHGSSPNVGITGYTLGGGVGFYPRKHGLACNRVTAIELVTAGGEQIRVDAENEPDLFWALRGGGGSFGVVTALEFDLLPLPRDLRGRPVVPRRTGERGSAGMERVDQRDAGGDDVGRSADELPADSGGARARSAANHSPCSR